MLAGSNISIKLAPAAPPSALTTNSPVYVAASDTLLSLAKTANPYPAVMATALPVPASA